MNGGWGKEMVKKRLELFVYGGGGGGGFWYALRRKVFADKGDLNLGGRGGGFYRLWQKLNGDG